MTQQDNDNAQSQARAQLRGIRELLAALENDWERLDDLRDNKAEAEADGVLMAADEAEELAELEAAAGEYTSQEDAERALYEDPLDIQYRSGWGSTREDMQPEEFQILLCTGGPAVRIMGELDFNGEPHRAWIEFQDWGTPWTMLFEGQAEALEYAQRLISI